MLRAPLSDAHNVYVGRQPRHQVDMPTVAAAARAGHSGAERAGVSALAVNLQGPVGVILTHPARVVAKIARHVSRFGAELKVVEDGATFRRCELSLYVTNPTHSQGSNTIYDFANLFSRVFWHIHRGVPLYCAIPDRATVRKEQGSVEAKTRPLWQFVWAISRRICVGHNSASVSRSIIPAGRIRRPRNVLQYLPRHAWQLGDVHRDEERLVAYGLSGPSGDPSR